MVWPEIFAHPLIDAGGVSGGLSGGALLLTPQDESSAIKEYINAIDFNVRLICAFQLLLAPK